MNPDRTFAYCIDAHSQNILKALILIGAFFLVNDSVSAQTSNSDSASGIESSTTVSPSKETNEYLIGVGDVLDIRVYNRPQLSREAIRVDGRGFIRMPLLEKDILAVCRTDSELAADISKLYLEYLRNPHVEVFIKDFQSKPVAIIGAVHDPGRFQLQRKVRLLELLAFAGGPTDLAGGRIQIKHDGSFQACKRSEIQPTEAIGSSENISSIEENVSWYDLRDLMERDATETNNPYVTAGDIVVLTEAARIYVVGNVYKPVTIPLREPITLTQAVAIAGGTLPDTNFERIRILRQKSSNAIEKTELIVNLKAINQRKTDDIILQPNDIIEVQSSSGKKFLHGLINAIAPTISRLPVRIIN